MRTQTRIDSSRRWTSPDLDIFPDDGNRYEIIAGRLYISDPTFFRHQMIVGNVVHPLNRWSYDNDLGSNVFAPGVVFAEDDDVAPDVVWISNERLADAIGPDGHLHQAPELIAEILWPIPDDEYQDRVAKLDLYSRRGVSEYWIVDGSSRLVEIHRHDGQSLKLAEILGETDVIRTPLLPGFSCEVADFFED
jgi:Uma2 family endonuclease